MSDPKPVSVADAPKAIGPYSQAVVAGGFVFTAGQIPLNPSTMKLVEGDIAAQTHRVFDNLEAILKGAGSSLARAVKATVYLADMADFAKMNEVYARYLGTKPPARTTIAAAGLPRGVRVEIDVIAAY